MPQDTPHPQYDKWDSVWEKCRDFAEGGDKVKSKGERYLPNFFKPEPAYAQRARAMQTDMAAPPPDASRQYEAYKFRAMVYGATGRTIDGLVGAAMRKPPDLAKLPRALDEFAADMLGTGVDPVQVASELLAELLICGRVGLLVDMAGENGDLRLCIYRAESIINWATDARTGRVNWAMLQEPYTMRDPEDGYAWIEKMRYRELLFDGQQLAVRLWYPPEALDDDWTGEDVEMTRLGEPLDFMPFAMVTPMGETAAITAPPILDLVNVNHDHYLLNADYKHGLHFCGLPTPWGAGIDVEHELPNGLTLGSTVAHVFADSSAKLQYLTLSDAEFSGIRQAMQDDLELMANLGARLLGAVPKHSETATAAQLHAAGETNALVTNVDAVGQALRRVFQMALAWETGDKDADIDVGMNKDFLNIPLPANEITALLAAYQAGSMSLPTFLWNLQQGERLPDNRSIDDEIALIEIDSNRIGAMPDIE